MTDAAPTVEIEALVLKVLAGRVRGASAPLERGQAVTVGHDLDADIVLRDPSAEGVRLGLKGRAAAADLDLLEGSVVLLGHELTAPAQAILPLYLPLMIGENAVAIGDPESTRWTEAERILAAAQPPLDDDDEHAQPPGQTWQYLLNNTNALVSRSMRFVPVLLIAVITVSALFAISSGLPAWPKMQPRPAKVQAVLLDEGFDGLSVSKSSEGELRIPDNVGVVGHVLQSGETRRVEAGAEDGEIHRKVEAKLGYQIRIEGVVATAADRARLRRVMTAHDWQPRVNVQTHEGMARQVEDFYMANGVEAAARAAGAGLVRLDVIGSNPEEAGRLQRLAMTEIKGLRRIDISMLPGADEGGRFEDMQEGGGKRVVSVIGGPQGHITTADGARYFPGAVLPTGHRIVSIEDTKVLVERNGSRSELNF